MSRYINPVPQITRILNGVVVPIVGAKLFFFEVGGTTTKKTIYSDSSLSISRANPVISDANGRYSDDIFLDGVYKVVQQDESGTPTGFDGVTIWTKDPVGEVSAGQFDPWANDATYNIPDIVLGSDDEYYRSIVDANQGNDPTSSPTAWELLSFGRIWNTNVTYSAGDSVYGSDGFLYLSRTSSNIGNNPTTDTTNWRSGAEVQFTKGADIASAATLITGSDGNYFDVTGTTTITAIAAVGVGSIIKLHFDGILTLTHNATDLILPGGANITTAAGDEVELYEYATGDWRCTNYERASGRSVIEPAASEGASYVLIESQTASASASIDFTTGIDGTYDEYEVRISNYAPVTDAAHLWMKISKDTGSTWVSGTLYRFTQFRTLDSGTSGFTSGVANAEFELITDTGTAAGEGASGVVRFTTPASTTAFKHFSADFSNIASTARAQHHIFAGHHVDATAYDGVQFLCSTGNIQSGEFRLYGIKK